MKRTKELKREIELNSDSDTVGPGEKLVIVESPIQKAVKRFDGSEAIRSIEHQLMHMVSSANETDEPDPIKLYHGLKSIEKLCDVLKKKLYNSALVKAEMYSENNFNHNGIEVTLVNGKKTYDYTNCKSWTDKKLELEKIEKSLKLAYQNYQSGNHTVSEDGEIVEIPAVTQGNRQIRTKLIQSQTSD